MLHECVTRLVTKTCARITNFDIYHPNLWRYSFQAATDNQLKAGYNPCTFPSQKTMSNGLLRGLAEPPSVSKLKGDDTETRRLFFKQKRNGRRGHYE